MSTFSELIDFTRSSTGTYLDSVVYGDELVTNGTFDTDSGWTLGTNASISGGTLSYSGGSGNVSSYQNIGLEANKTYHITATVSGYVQGHLSFRAGGNLTDTPDITANGTYSFVFTVPSNGNFNFMIDASTTFVGTIDNVSVKEVIGGQGTAGTPLLRTADTNEPRLEYDASGQPLGLLIEEQRTNNLSNSNNASVLDLNASGITTAVNSSEVQAPSNTETVIKLNKTGGGYGYARTSYSAVTYAQTLSVFVKKGTARYVGLRQLNTAGSSNHTTFDLDTKTWTHTGYSDSRGYQDYGNGWLRIWVAEDGSSKTWASVAIVDANGTENNSETGTLYVYGFQREAGSFPTSYIPTSGSTVTRTGDVCSLPLERYHHNAQSYTMYAEFQSSPKVPSNFERVWVLSNDDSTSDYLQLQYNTSNAMQVYSRYNSGGNGSISPIEVTDTTNKVALKVDGTVMRSACNGVLQSGTLSNAVEDFTKLTIGASDSISLPLNSHIKVIQSYAKGLTDAQLIELTKPSSSPTMSLTFDGQATSELVEGLHD